MMGPTKTNFKTVQAPSGVSDLHSLMLFMDNKEKYTQYLSELTNLIKDANEAIETVGKAKDIDNLLADARVKSDKMDSIESSAQEKATLIVGEAEVKARNMLNDASERSDELLTESQTYLNSAKNKDSELKSKETYLNTQEKDLVSRETSLDKRLEDCIKREAEIKRKQAVLSQL